MYAYTFQHSHIFRPLTTKGRNSSISYCAKLYLILTCELHLERGRCTNAGIFKSQLQLTSALLITRSIPRANYTPIARPQRGEDCTGFWSQSRFLERVFFWWIILYVDCGYSCLLRLNVCLSPVFLVVNCGVFLFFELTCKWYFYFYELIVFQDQNK